MFRTEHCHQRKISTIGCTLPRLKMLYSELSFTASLKLMKLKIVKWRIFSFIYSRDMCLFLIPVAYAFFAIKTAPSFAFAYYFLILLNLIIYPISRLVSKRRWLELVRGFLIASGVGIGTLIFVQSVILQPAYVNGSGMEPIYKNTQRVISDRTSYWFSEPQRGEIILFHEDDKNKVMIVSRIVGLPGDTIGGSVGEILVNGIIVEEPYVSKDASSLVTSAPQLLVAKGKYLVINDNRTIANEGYYYELVDAEMIIAKVKSHLFPWMHS